MTSGLSVALPRCAFREADVVTARPSAHATVTVRRSMSASGRDAITWWDIRRGGRAGALSEGGRPAGAMITAMRFLSIVFVLALSTSLDAHHAISAIYDNSKPITVQGTVVEFHFVNPHPYLTIDVVD